MLNWLNVISAFSSVSRQAGALQQCCDALERLPNIVNAGVLMLSEDSKSLVPFGWHGRLPAWQVADLTQPFTRSIRQNKVIKLSHSDRLYWQDSQEFAQFAFSLDSRATLVVQPLDNLAGAIPGLLVMEVQQGENEWLASDDFVSMTQILANHLTLLQRLDRQIASRKTLSQDVQALQNKACEQEKYHQLERILIGDTAQIEQLRKHISKAAQSSLSVLIQGETGTGKDLVAKAIHQLSPCSNKQLIIINCAAIPENLLESELFGYQAGAFSGALKAKSGLIKEADGGTLFLDEIGDMPLPLQAKLLRVIEDGKFRPLGSTQEESASFRLICATHVHLKQRVEEGEFRRDLFYRISQFPILCPSLRERKGDLLPISQHLIQLFNQQQQRQVQGIRYAALNKLNEHHFPGNIRELKNVIEFACAHTCDFEEIALDALPQLETETTESSVVNTPTSEQAPCTFEGVNDLKAAIQEYERQLIKRRLNQYHGDRGKAALSLGLPKRTLAHKCQRLEITVE
ncbi:sigma 54-interacting transcriptional regulator [Motilimonas sp. 1_MG-2023]|uniref:sigma-54 interaction domain-containing protein n=1 Tax=Motilimonas sp. 1_MG-2023 TaxID=3062672 RepID=UPI0026E1439C|nr:sigma 54-interacting transcriptional regulator [Motilimonas sp. 1_MG-2023]MDO6527514.1 sigma 54-interacting transcriptional regulator [Motilimonas sp. 1_MG-2023]